MATSLVLSLALGAISDTEYLAFCRSRSRRTRRWKGQKFALSKFSDIDCLELFRFTRHDIRRIKNLLHFPRKFKLWNRMVVPAEEVLCLVLARLSYPCRLRDLSALFLRHRTVLSNMFNVGLDFIYARTRSLLSTLQQPFLTPERLALYAENVAETTDDLTRPMKIWAFIDGTTRPICRPSDNQRIVYDGKDRVHALKFQAVTSPDGMIIHLAGPIEGARHDSHMFRESGLLQLVAEKTAEVGQTYRLYGDPAYSLSDHLITPYRNAKRKKHIKFNEILAQVRVAVEWSFGKVLQYFAFTDFSKNQKMLLQPVAKYYIVSVVLTNMHTCLYQSLCGKTFDILAPTLEEYLEGVTAEGKPVLFQHSINCRCNCGF